jgi:HAD superfamily hydrolase (TIGR01459 family)
MSDEIKICEGISDISDSYSGFLIDQWGTLHDGQKPYDGVIETLQMLKDRKKQIIIVSNSGQRETQNRDRLTDMGFNESLFDHVVTSAEVTWKMLTRQDIDELSDIGSKCLLLTRNGNKSILNDTDIKTVETVDEADFILLAGSDAPEKLFENYYDPILKAASRKRLKLVCANPEMKVTIDGTHYLGSGDIAKRYTEFGGVVTYIGKPFPYIYQHAISLFQDVLPSQMIMIGDSLAHDVRGAQLVGLDSALVANGVHAGSFRKIQSMGDIRKILKMMGQNYGITPTYFVPRFKWGKALPDRKNKRKSSKK